MENRRFWVQDGVTRITVRPQTLAIDLTHIQCNAVTASNFKSCFLPMQQCIHATTT